MASKHTFIRGKTPRLVMGVVVKDRREVGEAVAPPRASAALIYGLRRRKLSSKARSWHTVCYIADQTVLCLGEVSVAEWLRPAEIMKWQASRI